MLLSFSPPLGATGRLCFTLVALPAHILCYIFFFTDFHVYDCHLISSEEQFSIDGCYIYWLCLLVQCRVILALTINIENIWATSWENLFMANANNKGADQPVHSRRLINNFVVRCLDNIIPLVSIPEIASLYLATVATQAACLPWSQTPKTGFLMTRFI